MHAGWYSVFSELQALVLADWWFARYSQDAAAAALETERQLQASLSTRETEAQLRIQQLEQVRWLGLPEAPYCLARSANRLDCVVLLPASDQQSISSLV